MNTKQPTAGVTAAPETPEQLRQITDARKRLENVPEHLRALLPADGVGVADATDRPAWVEEVRDLLREAYQFQSTSPRAQENINAALELIDANTSGVNVGQGGKNG